jgi:eukaryotic-like serine/threonine-protein kinase
MIGTSLGHYRIERLLGSGGMSDVYLAEDMKLGRQVALKVLSHDVARDPERRERFEREARAAAALNHPHIVTIHSVEEVDGLTFLTFELIEGHTLAEIIPTGGLSLDRMLDLGIALADGVGAAHQRGITHRDLKPANVMLTSDGRLKILDFGLAKIKEDIRGAEGSMLTALLTGEGRIVGTVAYMSPEQAEAKPVDQRSDVFSLGVILYEMATGVRPFQGDTQMSTLSAIIKDTPKPLADLRPGLPRDVTKIVTRCLAKDPEDRYQTAKDLRNDLRALKSDLAAGEVQAAERSGDRVGFASVLARRRNLLIAAGVLAVVALAAMALWSTPSGRSDSGKQPFDSIKLAGLTTTGTIGSAAVSPDGRYVAYVSFTDGKWTLSLRQIATTSNVELMPPDEVLPSGLAFGPDGNYIYYVSYGSSGTGTLYRIPILGGGASRIVEGIDTSVTFSPDGGQFAFLRRDPNDGSTALVLASVDGTKQRALTTRKRPQVYVLNGVSWSADGRTIAAVAGNEQDSRRQIVLADVSTGKETVLPTPEWRTVGRVAWLPERPEQLFGAQHGG